MDDILQLRVFRDACGKCEHRNFCRFKEPGDVNDGSYGRITEAVKTATAGIEVFVSEANAFTIQVKCAHYREGLPR